MRDRIEIELVGGPVEVADFGESTALPLVWLHEGLGSIELWRDVPAVVSERLGGARSIVYSRHGHGRSGPAVLPRRSDYMHHEADVVLPELLALLDVERPVLVGHSDGASIALLAAGAGVPVESVVCLAPHVFVEDESISGITAARDAFESTDLPIRMARYHDDPAATFRGWNDVWLSDEFRTWNIEDRLHRISAPVLLVQGARDQYGTFAQLDAIESALGGPVERLELAEAGHAPHLDARDAVLDAIVRFLRSSTGR